VSSRFEIINENLTGGNKLTNSSTYKFFGLLILSISMAGCAHSVMRGSVAMKVSDTEAHVCMNKDEVKIGDHVELYANVCSREGKEQSICNKVSRGHGTVTEIINEHYSLVKFEQGAKFEEGNFIELHAH